MGRRAASLTRVKWAVPYVPQLRLLRILVLTVGLALGLALGAGRAHELLEPPFVLGAMGFAAATGLTLTPAFGRLQAWALTVVSLLDVATIGMFDLIPGVEMVGALVVFPAMWLGAILGRRGVAIAALTSALLIVAPGVFIEPGPTWGPPERTPSEAISIVIIAVFAAAGISLSAAMWGKQLRSTELQGVELEKAMKAKGDFISLVSHELRTPLTSIIGYLDLVNDVEEPIPEQALHHLAAVSRNADRLLLLVTDLLSSTQVENGPVRLAVSPTDLTSLARLSLDDVDQRASDAGLVLIRELAPGLTITADPNRLLQVLDNLLSNATKFTPPGGRITVTTRKNRDGVDLVVTDTGMGIDADSLPHLGTKFFRTPSTSDKGIPGIGLGLMLTKNIVEAHHGTLTISSREHEGTTVQIYLPKAPPTHAAAPDTRFDLPTTFHGAGGVASRGIHS